jgi:hypothetical protein
MITPSQHAKVLDMGLSKNTLEKASSTMGDTLLGTPNYMSPEQIDHPQRLDTRSDMFSVGMTLYHMLTGQVPFEQSSYLKTLKRHASDTLEDPRKLMPGISCHAVCFLSRLLAREPEDRYSDWEQFQVDLREVMSRGQIPQLPEGPSSLRVDPEPLREADAVDGPIVQAPPAAKPTRRGIWISVLTGMAVGSLAVTVFGRLFPQAPPAPPVVQEEPAPAATEVLPPPPLPAPTDVPAEYQQRLAQLILDYESGRISFDPMIRELVQLGQRANGTVVSEQAAYQIVQVRRDRDQALQKERGRVRRETLEILYQQGGAAADRYLQNLDSPFLDELQEMIGNLRRRIRIVEQQEQDQREEERIKAETRWEQRKQEAAARILSRELAGALSLLDEAARDPALFPVTEKIADLRQEVIDLQEVPHLMMAEFERVMNRPLTLQVQDRMVNVTIRAVEADGLRVERAVTDDQGRSLGTVEQNIAFSQLNPNEVLRRLEPLKSPAADITRGLIAYRNGEQEKCREALLRADTPLADAIRNQLFALPTLDMFEN